MALKEERTFLTYYFFSFMSNNRPHSELNSYSFVDVVREHSLVNMLESRNSICSVKRDREFYYFYTTSENLKKQKNTEQNCLIFKNNQNT